MKKLLNFIKNMLIDIWNYMKGLKGCLIPYLICCAGFIATIWLQENYEKNFYIAIALCVCIGGVLLGICNYHKYTERKTEQRRNELIELSTTIKERYNPGVGNGSNGKPAR